MKNYYLKSRPQIFMIFSFIKICPGTKPKKCQNMRIASDTEAK